MNNDLPLFYRELAAFDINTHGKMHLPDSLPDYKFAAQTNIIPLLVHEAGLASRHYPLVFIPGSEGGAPVLAAMVGVGDNVNCFVDAEGKWLDGAYIPAWVRRYPFFAVREEEGKDPLLAIDPAAEWLQQDEGETLTTESGEPSQRLERVLAFQREFQLFAERTEAITMALQEAGVLEEGAMRIDPPRGASEGDKGEAGGRQINGFMLVNEGKLKALSDEALLKLHQADALGLAYIQLISMASLPNLVRQVAVQAAPVREKPVKGKSRK